MKALFEKLTIGIEGEKIRLEGLAEIELDEAYKLARFLNEQIREVEEIQRKKLPWGKRMFR